MGTLRSLWNWLLGARLHLPVPSGNGPYHFCYSHELFNSSFRPTNAVHLPQLHSHSSNNFFFQPALTLDHLVCHLVLIFAREEIQAIQSRPPKHVLLRSNLGDEREKRRFWSQWWILQLRTWGLRMPTSWNLKGDVPISEICKRFQPWEKPQMLSCFEQFYSFLLR